MNGPRIIAEIVKALFWFIAGTLFMVYVRARRDK